MIFYKKRERKDSDVQPLIYGTQISDHNSKSKRTETKNDEEDTDVNIDNQATAPTTIDWSWRQIKAMILYAKTLQKRPTKTRREEAVINGNRSRRLWERPSHVITAICSRQWILSLRRAIAAQPSRPTSPLQC